MFEGMFIYSSEKGFFCFTNIIIRTSRTAFVFDNEICEQIDSVSMGSPLAPVLANIIMTELENTMIKEFILYRKNKVLLSLR